MATLAWHGYRRINQYANIVWRYAHIVTRYCYIACIAHIAESAEKRFLVARHPAPAEPSSTERIRDAALKSFAAKGIAATSLKTVAEAAGISIGLVQHYYGTKAALIAAVDDYVLQVISNAVESIPLPSPPEDPLVEMGRRVTALLAEQTDVIDYLGRALAEGESIGSEIFDGLVGISTAQGHSLIEQGQVSPDVDLVWAALNPLMLRLGPIILRAHIERHIPEPFNTPTQLRRWDTAVTALIRQGQMQPQMASPPGLCVDR
jgi:TetR/AcrR family transcriptional regulator, regulator of cefoperazone and chloramphenicol sensitivity